MTALVGIDVGTSAVKTIAVSTTGEIVARVSCPGGDSGATGHTAGT